MRAVGAYLQIAFGCERFLAHIADEWTFAGMRTHVNL